MIGGIYKLNAGVFNSTGIKHKYNAGSWDSDKHNRQNVSDIDGEHPHTSYDDVLVFNSLMRWRTRGSQSTRSRRLNIYNMHGIQPHTGSNINNSQIIHDIKSSHSQKMSWYAQQTILTFAVGFLDSWYTIYIGLLITITHHKYTFLIHSTPMKLMCTQQTTLRDMCRLLGILAYPPDVKCPNEYHTSHTRISFPQHIYEVLIHTIGKTFVTFTSIKLMGLHNADRNKYSNMQFAC